MTDVLTVRGGFLALAALATGLAAGLFYTFDVAVMRGLASTDDRTFVTAMRQINIKILNGLFAFSFGGALVFTLIALGLNREGPTVWWIVAAAVLYAVQLGITFRVNVPLNDALVADGDPAKMTDPHRVRTAFEAKWVRWNHVRTWLCLAAFLSLLGALAEYGRSLP
ncbi:anthrone oxygenase family protein [Asanoa iriomotensis]|uniref:Membrane protein n=1 Tax=Asanoa iriomotensis TaxID=234613 RepID=A0ABQ4C246_9ACTN|nr:anthrone oxygenase family protein [Asanoa iriomotensis]GIF56855.1 membrane protein [Asanoa iriomotensis]